MKETLLFQITVAVCYLLSVPALWFSRRILKPYLGYETAIYKWWWQRYVEKVQYLLDNQHKTFRI